MRRQHILNNSKTILSKNYFRPLDSRVFPLPQAIPMSSNQSSLNPEIERWTFTVPLALEAHARAEQFRLYQSDARQAKQIYLNTLAVYATNVYLQCRGFETDLEQSASGDSIMQILMEMDVADLLVKNRGKLECRPVLPDAEVMHVPAEVWDDRIGYVAVQLDQSLREATVLGFTDPVKRLDVPLHQLRSLSELPEYLNQIKPRPLVNLSQWLEGVFEAGWQAIESLLDPRSRELTFSFREAVAVRRCKLIELTPSQSVVMIVTLTQPTDREIEICVEVLPPPGQTYLPSNLQLLVLDEDGETLLNAYARSENQSIQLEFFGKPRDGFSVKVVFEDISVSEYFVI